MRGQATHLFLFGPQEIPIELSQSSPWSRSSVSGTTSSEAITAHFRLLLPTHDTSAYWSHALHRALTQRERGQCQVAPRTSQEALQWQDHQTKTVLLPQEDSGPVP